MFSFSVEQIVCGSLLSQIISLLCLFLNWYCSLQSGFGLFASLCHFINLCLTISLLLFFWCLCIERGKYLFLGGQKFGQILHHFSTLCCGCLSFIKFVSSIFDFGFQLCKEIDLLLTYWSTERNFLLLWVVGINLDVLIGFSVGLR